MKKQYKLAILFLAVAITFCGTATATEQNNTNNTQTTIISDTPNTTQYNSLPNAQQILTTSNTRTTSTTQATNSDAVPISGNIVTTNTVTTTTLPTNYDLRTLGKVTPVKNQGTAASCWTFATCGSLESCLLPYENDDFSENNMKNLLSSNYTNGFERVWSDGGSYKEALAYLARWSGPVNESQDPYNDSSGVSPTDLSPVKHVQDALNLPERTGPLDNGNIKLALMNYGAVATAIYYDDRYYDNITYSYYYNNSATSSNHCIDIVGWDDNYSSTNFNTPPPGNGAFIIKNSWGTSWGENGYFYLSYYNPLAEFWVFNNAEPTNNYNKIYQYDPLGWCSSRGYGNETGWFSNVFTSTGNDKLAAASFYACSPNSNYELYVYLNPTTDNPKSGTLAATKTGTVDSGYWTIKLDSAIKLITGQVFSVVVRLTTPGNVAPIAIESYTLNAHQASSSPKESYISSDGINWSDLTEWDSSANVCLKAFTIPYIRVTSIDPANKATNVAVNKVINITFSEAIKAGSSWIDFKNSAGTSIPFTTSITGNILTIHPTNSLTEGKYTLTLHTGTITDLAGNPLALWSSIFTAGTPPTMTITDPVNGAVNVAASKTITVTFNEAIKQAGSFWIELKNSAGTPIPFTKSIIGNVLTVDPTNTLTESLYTLIIHSGAVTDLAGNPVVSKSIKFSVGTSPIVANINPLNGATNVVRNKTITVTFNENIKAGSNYWIELVSNNGTAVVTTKSISGKVLTMTHSTILAANTKYTLIIHTGSLTDLAGNPVAVKSFIFTTGST